MGQRLSYNVPFDPILHMLISEMKEIRSDYLVTNLDNRQRKL